MSNPTERAHDRIFKSVRSRLPSVMDDFLEHEYFLTLDEFLQSSNVWQEDVPVRVVAARTEYDFEPQDAHALITNLIAIQNSNDIVVKGSMPTPGRLLLHSEPTASETFQVTVALTVVDPVTSTGYPEVPAWILQRYSAALIDGLLSRMMSQPAKPYSNERLAIFHARRFVAAKAAARAAARKQHLFGGQRWRFPQGWAVGRQ